MIETEIAPQLQECRELVERVVSSDVICRSKRLREMFLYLCRQVLEEEAEHIHELELGHRVFGKPAFYDTAGDNTVRVHASTLRKRLAEYFQTQGRDEALIIEIPRGNYAPVFRYRERAANTSPARMDAGFPSPASSPGETPRTSAIVSEPGRVTVQGLRLWPFALAGVGLLLIALVWWLVQPRESTGSRRRTDSFAAGSDAGAFWGQVFPRDGAAKVVLDDSSLDFYEQVTNRRVTPGEYFDRSYLNSVDERAGAAHLDPRLIRSVLLRRQSTFASVNLLSRLSDAAGRVGSRSTVVFGRDLGFRELKADNLVLLGTSQSNPWIQLFEPHLAIQWKNDPDSGASYPIDSRVNPPDENRFHAPIRQGAPPEGYASIALLPNLEGRGHVLIISGTGGSAVGSALDFLTDESSIRDLRSRLPASAGFPAFEVLLRAEKGAGLARNVTVVMCRRPDPLSLTSLQTQPSGH